MIIDKWKNGAIPALLIHSCIGTVYCWSVLSGAVSEALGSSCEWAFSLAIFFLGISAAFIGPLVERNVKMASLISTIFFGTGMILSGIACSIGNSSLFHISYGVIMGIGLGIGYISPIKTIMMWFNKNKGLAAGIAIAGFGIAKILGGPGFAYFLNHFGISETLVFHGILYTLIMLFAVLFIKKPDTEDTEVAKEPMFMSWFKDLITVFKLKNIWIFWLVFYLNISAGLAIISNEAVFFKHSGITAFGIGMAVSLCAIFNSLGRLSFAWVSDFLKNRCILFGIILAISVIACCIGISSPSGVTWTVLLCNAGYGAMFAIMPSALHDKYGMNLVSIVHGVILSAWAFAGLTGNQVAQIALQLPYSYSPRIIILIATILYLTGLVLSIKLLSNKKSNQDNLRTL